MPTSCLTPPAPCLHPKPGGALAEPIPGERELALEAAHTLKRLGAHYGDVRLGRNLTRLLRVEDENLVSHRVNESSGIGMRARIGGSWGFAATPDLSSAGVEACARRALAMARAVHESSGSQASVAWAEEPVHNATHHTHMELCPFTTPTQVLAEPLVAAARAALQLAGIRKVVGRFAAFGQRRTFANTECTKLLTTHAVADAEQVFYAVAEGNSAYRTLFSPGVAGGCEHFLAANFPARAWETAKEALAKCTAEPPPAGRYNLILDGHNLALTMHESVGHPTERDRVLGYELSFAGGSFASLDKLGTFRYGSPLVNFTANNGLHYGGASQGFDDEGVLCQSFPVVRDGILVGYGANRETAAHIGLSRANGTTRADNWDDVPIVRIPNLYLEPGKESLSLAELIADTKDGIYMMGRDSFSIDQMRYNFQFGANMSYRIRNGRLAEPLRDVIYQAITPEFWGSLDATCDASEWQMHGIVNCGKGAPVQSARMTHGASPSRFRNIRVGY